MKNISSMSRIISRVVAGIMLVGAIAFVAFALGHPELSWPWSNTITYILYVLYAAAMIFLFIAPFKSKKK